MTFVKAKPNEYLVIGRNGKVTNWGTAITVFLWPGSTFVLIPSTKQEAQFEITQETRDGIPLRFKGIVIYRVIDPVIAAQMFDFSRNKRNFVLEAGVNEINALINHFLLGELRDIVSHLTMRECIEGRKDTLTKGIENALREVANSPGENDPSPGRGWGIEIEVVQVAQVFIVDDDLRRQLEAEVRNEIKARSDQSLIRTEQEIRLTEIASEREINQEQLEAEKQRIANEEEIEFARLLSQRKLLMESLENEREENVVARERNKLNAETKHEKIESEYPVKLNELSRQRKLLNEEITNLRIHKKNRELEVQTQMLLDTAKQALRKEILPLEQVPLIAKSLSHMFQGVDLTIYDQDSPLLTPLVPIIDHLTKKVVEAANAISTNSSASSGVENERS